MMREVKRERKKSLSGNQANRKWISGEQGIRKLPSVTGFFTYLAENQMKQTTFL
jgi:hypothetical protein